MKLTIHAHLINIKSLSNIESKHKNLMLKAKRKFRKVGLIVPIVAGKIEKRPQLLKMAWGKRPKLLNLAGEKARWQLFGLT